MSWDLENYKKNKNTFQKDAYRPLVDRMPESASREGGCLLRGVSAPGGCLLWGVSTPGLGVSAPRGVSALGGICLGGVCSGGLSAPGGCLLQGGCLLRGVSAPEGCLLPWGVCSRGMVVFQHALRQTPPLWTESQTPVKTLPWPNFVAAGNYDFMNVKKRALLFFYHSIYFVHKQILQCLENK